MRTRRNSRNSRTRRAKRALRRLHDPPSRRTLKSLKNLSYRDLKALSSEQLQKYKRGLHIIDQEGNPYTNEALRKKLRSYISAGSKKGGGKSAYFEFKKGSSRKFWRIMKDGSKLTTHYGRIGTLGQTTTKDYGSKVDKEYEKLIQSKKKKGYVEKTDYGVSNRATSIEREYMKVCRKAEKSKVLNPNQVNADCEGMLDQGEKELKWMTKWHKDALKKGEYNWDKYEDHYKSRKKK